MWLNLDLHCIFIDTCDLSGAQLGKPDHARFENGVSAWNRGWGIVDFG